MTYKNIISTLTLIVLCIIAYQLYGIQAKLKIAQSIQDGHYDMVDRFFILEDDTDGLLRTSRTFLITTDSNIVEFDRRLERIENRVALKSKKKPKKRKGRK
jgi:hypothetical protein